MNFYDYIGVTPYRFETEYVNLGFVQRQKHKQFPLDIYAYTRKTVHENLWDNVTSRCRGIVVHRETGEIIARPFEKFHNFGQSNISGTEPENNPTLFTLQPTIWEKVDGFMCTLYRWDGQPYVASKGSFSSIHSKWATAWYRKNVKDKWPKGYTPVFEGIHPDLRIVVNYGTDEGLVLLAVINNETGEEVSPTRLTELAEENGVETPTLVDMTWQRAKEELGQTYSDGFGTEEGYVLTWYRAGAPPERLKMKFYEYLRLHRMVTGTSPKRIWEYLSNGEEDEVKEWLANSTPWFAEFVKKWTTALTEEYKDLETRAAIAYTNASAEMTKWICEEMAIVGEFPNLAAVRKGYANRFMTPEHKKLAPVLFAMLDKKDTRPVLWRLTKHLIVNSKPMVDAHSL
jgi:RNA ligase